MPIYPYRCDACGYRCEVVRSIKDPITPQTCVECDEVMEYVFTPPASIIGASVESYEFNPGLGCVTKNKRHRESIAKERGLIELGNETQETIHKETVIKREKEIAKEWERL